MPTYGDKLKKKLDRDNETQFMTPPAIARRWGVATEKVYHLIHTKQVNATNLACDLKGRPRWRIAISEIERFEQARSNKPPAPKPRRRRRTTTTAGKEYF